MYQLIAIAGGGAVGALLRFWVSRIVHAWTGTDFPYGTFVINISGSLMMGFFFVLLAERTGVAPEWRAVILVGFLGAFTTFSTFSLEALTLMIGGEIATAMIYVVASVVLCIFAVWLGMWVGRQL
ncbi:MAG: fluoride efflux transporter CrcB [Gammaproteobacteria bacterium]|nr:fluoride efflux transporter CrcB [Gammaproteobacteria bacterium]